MGTAAGAVAALVGFSRVHAGVHYPGDVAIGALIGAGCGAAAGPLAVRLVDRSRFAHLITPDEPAPPTAQPAPNDVRRVTARVPGGGYAARS